MKKPKDFYQEELSRLNVLLLSKNLEDPEKEEVLTFKKKLKNRRGGRLWLVLPCIYGSQS